MPQFRETSQGTVLNRTQLFSDIQISGLILSEKLVFACYVKHSLPFTVFCKASLRLIYCLEHILAYKWQNYSPVNGEAGVS